MEYARISDIEIKSFRSLRRVNWQLGDLNVVIGPNASGKSNLLKFLRFICASANGELASHVNSEGGMGSIAWGSKDKEVGGRVKTSASQGYVISYEYNLELQRTGGSSGYRIYKEDLLSSASDIAKAMYTRGLGTFDFEDIGTETAQGFTQVVNDPESFLSLARSPIVRNEALRSVQRDLASILVLDDFHTEHSANLRQAVTSRHETRLSQNGQNLPEVLHTLYESDYEFKEQIDAAMAAAFGAEYKELAFPPAADQQIQLAVRWSSLPRPEPSINLSDGTLRFLFIIAALSQPDPPPLIAIDEPETGLHPKMMRIIAEYAEDAALRTQVLFTTHSSAFLDGFRKERPPMTAVTQLVDGETRLKVVDADFLARWLRDYTLGGLYRSRELEQMPGNGDGKDARH